VLPSSTVRQAWWIFVTRIGVGTPAGYAARSGAARRDAACRGRADAPEEERCWYRPNDYLQHSADETDARNMPIMTSVEVFTEADYGNTVFVDELMTGEWN